ncbi:MAG: hypothetical protein AAF590_00365 [Pseudomonadota bacterium]
MPALFGAFALAVGGMLVWRFARREWTRVNKEMDAQRRDGLPGEREASRKLERDPDTGTYRPTDD